MDATFCCRDIQYLEYLGRFLKVLGKRRRGRAIQGRKYRTRHSTPTGRKKRPRTNFVDDQNQDTSGKPQFMVHGQTVHSSVWLVAPREENVWNRERCPEKGGKQPSENCGSSHGREVQVIGSCMFDIPGMEKYPC